MNGIDERVLEIKNLLIALLVFQELLRKHTRG